MLHDRQMDRKRHIEVGAPPKKNIIENFALIYTHVPIKKVVIEQQNLCAVATEALVIDLTKSICI